MNGLCSASVSDVSPVTYFSTDSAESLQARVSDPLAVGKGNFLMKALALPYFRRRFMVCSEMEVAWRLRKGGSSAIFCNHGDARDVLNRRKTMGLTDV